MHGNAVLRLCRKNTLEGCEGTLQIIQSSTSDKFFFRPQKGRFLSVVKEEIPVQNALLFHGKRLCDNLLETALPFLRRKQGKHILLCIELIAVVDFPIHVDSEIRDNQEIPVDVQEPRFYALCCSKQHSSRYGKRSVQPRRTNHSAVLLHIELDIGLVYLDFRIRLHFKDRRITVTRHHLKALNRLLRKNKGD